MAEWRWAQAFGAARVVTSTSGAANIALARSFGADVVTDYKKQDIFSALPDASVDIVYDNFGAAGTADRAMRTVPSIIERRPALFFLGHICSFLLVFSPFFRCSLRLDARIPESGTRRPGAGCVTVENGRGKSGRRRPILGG